jgi:hypothetical protein
MNINDGKLLLPSFPHVKTNTMHSIINVRAVNSPSPQLNHSS